MWDWQKRKIEVTEHRLQDGCSGGGRQENLNVESIGPGQRRRDRITYELNGGAVISEMLWFETLRARNEAVTAGNSKIGTEVAAEFSGQRRVWHVCSSELGSSAKLSHLLWHLRRHLYVHSHPTLAEYRSPADIRERQPGPRGMDSECAVAPYMEHEADHRDNGGCDCVTHGPKWVVGLPASGRAAGSSSVAVVLVPGQNTGAREYERRLELSHQRCRSSQKAQR